MCYRKYQKFIAQLTHATTFEVLTNHKLFIGNICIYGIYIHIYLALSPTECSVYRNVAQRSVKGRGIGYKTVGHSKVVNRNINFLITSLL